MVKFHLLVLAAAVAGTTSALQVYEHVNYGGSWCDVPSAHTSAGQCVGIPFACAGKVSSVIVPATWTCKLYEGYNCNGALTDVWDYVPTLADYHNFNDRAYSVKCWTYMF
ncbi:hypothetical protein BGX34_001656 [Mortierella sp. NVP85]|nr:hypothetical protein BGX34_001656 [Mortierella sp. NVP85]